MIAVNHGETPGGSTRPCVERCAHHRGISCTPFGMLLGIAVACAVVCRCAEAGPLPVADADVARHYGSFEVPSFSSTSYEDVRKDLIQGRPIVVLDGAKGLPMASWDCDFVRREFPKSRIRQEGGTSEVNAVTMDSNWTKKMLPYPGADKYPAGAPRNRPFYWDIAKAWRDEGYRKWGDNPGQVVEKIVASSAVPYWLPSQEAARLGQSSEMWFHPPGAGARAHMDPHCSTTVSFCFSGARKWRMMVPPREPHPAGYFDGDVYSRRGEWQPTFEVEAPAGSAVVVYPGMIHETLSTGEKCSSSISQVFDSPVPAAYFRAFWPRFALIAEDVGRCGHVVESLATLDSGVRVPRSEKKAQEAAEDLASRADTDGDGMISEAEMHSIPRRQNTLSVEELVSFHDTNKDGLVSVKEVVESWQMVSAAARQAANRFQQRRGGGEL